jgi:hypothetical protein
MTQEAERQREQEFKLLKLERLEEMGVALELRWRRAGRLSRIEEHVREFLSEVQRSALPVKHKKNVAGGPKLSKPKATRRRARR